MLTALLLFTTALFLAGLFLPAITMNWWVFETGRYSIAGAVIELFTSGQVLLGLLVLVFSIVLPLAKLAALALMLRKSGTWGAPRWLVNGLQQLGRWAMLDVFVVALLVFSLQTGSPFEAHTQPGLYCFIAAVVLSLFLSWRISDGKNRAQKRRQ